MSSPATHVPLPPKDAEDSSQLPPPLYEVEEQPVERRINLDGQHVELVNGKEVVIERRQQPGASSAPA
jgi:hypothetical protein